MHLLCISLIGIHLKIGFKFCGLQFLNQDLPLEAVWWPIRYISIYIYNIKCLLPGSFNIGFVDPVIHLVYLRLIGIHLNLFSISVLFSFWIRTYLLRQFGGQFRDVQYEIIEHILQCTGLAVPPKTMDGAYMIHGDIVESAMAIITRQDSELRKQYDAVPSLMFNFSVYKDFAAEYFVGVVTTCFSILRLVVMVQGRDCCVQND